MNDLEFDLTLDEEQLELREAAHEFVKESPLAEGRVEQPLVQVPTAVGSPGRECP